MKKLVIFDFDGTLADTSEGILYCYQNSAKSLGYEFAIQEKFQGVIGGNVERGFKKVYAMDDAMANIATRKYRQLYKTEGTSRASLYNGIDKALKTLKDKDYLIALATLKHENFASKMLENLGILHYFDFVGAYNGNPECDKMFLLKLCCSTLNVDKKNSVLVGDSEFDAIGAKSAKIDFIAVTYGLGFKSKNDVKKLECKAIASCPSEIFEIVNSL